MENQLLKNSADRLYLRLCDRGLRLEIDKHLSEDKRHTVWSFAYKKYGWYFNFGSFDGAMGCADRLRRAKPDYIDADGYYTRCEPTFDQCWHAIENDIAKYGVVLSRCAETVRISYKYIPEIWVSTLNVWRGKIFRAAELKFDFTGLQRQLVSQYGTPYQEEVVQLKLLAELLPQPIAEAISDCIMAVIERRFIPRSMPQFVNGNILAAAHEIACEAFPEYISTISAAEKMTDRREWEATAARLVKAQKEYLSAHNTTIVDRYKSRSSSESEDALGIQCFGGDDGW